MKSTHNYIIQWSKKVLLLAGLLGVAFLAPISSAQVVDDADNLMVPEGEVYTLNGVHAYNQSVLIEGTLLTAAPHGELHLMAPLIEVLGTIDGNFAGYNGDEGPGVGGNEGGGGGGGGYGGIGSGGVGSTGGYAYGSAFGYEIHMGSGGANVYSGTTGGKGGAAVILEGNNIQITGVVTVNGQKPNDYTWAPGGGAGGGILLSGWSVIVGGILSANGGHGGNGTWGGGGGGGGRIKIFACDWDTTGSTITSTGGQPGGSSWPLSPGQNGTIAVQSRPFPVIAQIMDIPNDQGRQVRLSWNASCEDAIGTPYGIVGYTVWRQIDPNLKPTSTIDAHNPWVLARRFDKTYPSGDWDYIGQVPARGEETYNYVAPTLADSTDAGIYESTFFVSAITADPLVYWDSPVASGYSVDNLAPGVPTVLKVAYNSGATGLTWEETGDLDVQYFKIYRGTTPTFEPSPGNLVQQTGDLSWTDPAVNPWGYYYRVSAVDFASNEGPAAYPDSYSGVDQSETPHSFALLGCDPNPFNPRTTIHFSVPAGGGLVRIDVFDIQGRHMRELLNAPQAAGQQHVSWDGTDDQGRSLASGVFFYRLVAPNYERTLKMTLVQ